MGLDEKKLLSIFAGKIRDMSIILREPAPKRCITWFKTMPKPYSDLATKNFKRQHRYSGSLKQALKVQRETIIDALNTFTWIATPEGRNFWAYIASQIHTKNGDMSRIEWPKIPPRDVE